MDDKKLFRISNMCLIGTIILGFIIVPFLPSQIAIHYVGNEADGYLNKWIFIIAIPLIMFVIHLFVVNAIRAKGFLPNCYKYVYYFFAPVINIGVFVFLILKTIHIL